MSAKALIPELEDALKNGSPDKRVVVLRRMTELFLNESDRLNEQQVGVFDDVLAHLIQEIETKALAQLSSNLAPVDNAPVEVIRRLSRNDEIAVAGPVLTQSKRLSEHDLIDIARSKGQGHLVAISGRASIPETVTDVLVERGNSQVHHTLAANSGAQFSSGGFQTLVKKSEGDEALAEKLGQRLDVPTQLLEQLVLRATDVARARLLAVASPQHRDKIQGAIAGIAKDISRQATGPRDFGRAETLVDRLNRLGRLNEAQLISFAKERAYEEMTATLALFCGVKTELIERLLKNIRHDGLIVACRAAKLNWTTVPLILEARFSRGSIPDHELEQARSMFMELSEAAAQRSIRFMSIQAATKKAS